MEKYYAACSKTSKHVLIKDGHITRPLVQVTRQQPNYEALKNVATLLNEQNEKIENMKKELAWLRWYSEELETHVPKQTVKKIKEFYERENND